LGRRAERVADPSPHLASTARENGGEGGGGNDWGGGAHLEKFRIERSGGTESRAQRLFRTLANP